MESYSAAAEEHSPKRAVLLAAAATELLQVHALLSEHAVALGYVDKLLKILQAHVPPPEGTHMAGPSKGEKARLGAYCKINLGGGPLDAVLIMPLKVMWTPAPSPEYVNVAHRHHVHLALQACARLPKTFLPYKELILMLRCCEWRRSAIRF